MQVVGGREGGPASMKFGSKSLCCHETCLSLTIAVDSDTPGSVALPNDVLHGQSEEATREPA